MSLLDILQVAVSNPNAEAWLRIIRQGETSQDPRAYYMVNGGTFIEDLSKHPWDGIPTTEGAKATGAYQFLGTTWAHCRLGLNLPDFGPKSQDLAALFLTHQRGALDDVLAGRIPTAMAKCAKEWISLPPKNWAAVYAKYGGLLNDQQPAAPIEERSETLPQPETSMGPLALLQLFGPILSSMIPQIGALLKPGSKAAGYAGIAQTVLDTITATAKSPNLQGAIEAMQSDPAIKTAVQQAVVTHPEIIGVLEIGGGIPAARAANLAVQNADKPFWYSPAIWVSMALLPLVYWIVGGVLVGGIEIKDAAPWYLQVLKIFGTSFNAETRSGTVNLVLGMVLGGIVGMYFGTSYGSMRKTELAAQATSEDKTT